jgi:2-polyprenyl-3-methyl-5-hydroxy-6-metoxy-1,4-benzoquinol methylase
MVRTMSTITETSKLDSSAGQIVHRDPLLDALPSLDDVVDKLRSGAMVADVGCGDGLSTILMAQAFPRSAFTGYDLHAESIATARERARQMIDSSLSGRNVRFDVADVTRIPAYAFDLVTSLHLLQDTEDPSAAARRVRQAIADDGTWMIVESRAGDSSAILDDAGFSRVRVAAETPFDIVVEARP